MSNDDMLNIFDILNSRNPDTMRVNIEGKDVSIVIRKSRGQILIGAEDKDYRSLVVSVAGLQHKRRL